MRARGARIAIAAALVATTAAVASTASAEAPPTAPVPAAAPAAPAADLPPGSTAAPVNPQPVTLVRPDGSTFTAIPWGDGFTHGYADQQGRTVVRRADGAWVPTTTPRPTVDGGATSGPTSGADDKRAGADGPAPAPGTPHTGTAKTLVILAQFTDQANTGTTAAQWASRYFGASASVKDYYAKNSYGALTISPATESSGTANDGVVGWVTLNRKHPNSQPITDDVVSVAKSAIVAANPFIDYSAYDADGSGAIDSHELHIVVIAAGYEGAYATTVPCGKAIWGHRSALVGADAPTLDTVAVGAYEGDGGYQMFGENHCDSASPGAAHLASMGIMVHEFGHDLGLPDLYPSGSEGGGAGVYSLMAYGTWLGGAIQGDTPAMLDPFSRLYEGWSSVSVIHGVGQSITVPAAETSSTVYQVLPNPYEIDWKSAISGNEVGMGEYFLIENRTNTGYDAQLPGCGILIWRIDESRPTSWPNDSTDNFLVELEQADGFRDLENGFNRGDDGDPFPGSSGNTFYGAGTSPGSMLSNGAIGEWSTTVPAGSCTASKAITVNAPATDAPRNDSSAGSAPIVLSTESDGYAGNSAMATAQDDDPVVPNTVGGASVWFRYVAPASGALSLTTAGSSFDTTLGLYTRSGSATTVVAQSDDATPGDRTSAIPGIAVTAGTIYYIVVDGFESLGRVGQGPYRLELQLDVGTSPAPFASFSALVKRQYQDLAGITPSSAQVTNWVNRIAANPNDQYQLISDLRTGADGTGNVDPVARLYRAYFLRDPDAGGFRYWVGKKRSGSNLATISNTFAGSSEFKNRYGSLSNQAFVNLIYQNVLGRAGEPSGVTFWTNQLNAGKKTRGQVMAGFSESSEFKRTSQPSIDLSVITLSMLGRQPTSPDIQYWNIQRGLGHQSNLALARWALALPAYADRVS